MGGLLDAPVGFGQLASGHAWPPPRIDAADRTWPPGGIPMADPPLAPVPGGASCDGGSHAGITGGRRGPPRLFRGQSPFDLAGLKLRRPAWGFLVRRSATPKSLHASCRNWLDTLSSRTFGVSRQVDAQATHDDLVQHRLRRSGTKAMTSRRIRSFHGFHGFSSAVPPMEPGTDQRRLIISRRQSQSHQRDGGTWPPSPLACEPSGGYLGGSFRVDNVPDTHHVVAFDVTGVIPL
jgi:hypothetical protein